MCSGGNKKKHKLPPRRSLASLFSRASGLPDWIKGKSPFPRWLCEAQARLYPKQKRPHSHVPGQTHDGLLKASQDQSGHVRPPPKLEPELVWRSVVCSWQSQNSGLLLLHTSCCLSFLLASGVSPQPSLLAQVATILPLTPEWFLGSLFRTSALYSGH